MNEYCTSVKQLCQKLNTTPKTLARSKKTTQTNTVVVTGATGWLGRHIVEDVFRLTNSNMILFIRANSDHHALERCAKTFKLHWNDMKERIKVVCIEDLAHTLPDMSMTVDSIIHCAANMSLALTVDEMWKDNVMAGQQLLEWGRRHGVQRFDCVSTLSVFVASNKEQGLITEDDDLMSSRMLYGGYAASKWAFEAWLSQQHDIDVAVHRLGLLSHSKRHGWAPDDGVAAWAKAWKQWGRPTWLKPQHEQQVDWTPTTYASEGIVCAMLGGHTGVFHWANQQAIPATVWHDVLQQRYGPLEGAWPMSDALGKHAHRSLGRWSNPQRFQRWWWHDIFQSSQHTYDASYAEHILPRPMWSKNELHQALRMIF